MTLNQDRSEAYAGPEFMLEIAGRLYQNPTLVNLLLGDLDKDLEGRLKRLSRRLVAEILHQGLAGVLVRHAAPQKPEVMPPNVALMADMVQATMTQPDNDRVLQVMLRDGRFADKDPDEQREAVLGVLIAIDEQAAAFSERAGIITGRIPAKH